MIDDGIGRELPARPVGLFDFVRLERSLGEILHVKFGTVSAKALKPAIGDEVLIQAAYV